MIDLDGFVDSTIEKIAEEPPVFPIKDLGLHPIGRRKPLSKKKLEVGDILLSTTDAAISEAIRKVTGSTVSHAAVYVGGSQVVESAGEVVTKTPLSKATRGDSFVAVYRMPKLTQKHKETIKKYLEEQVTQKKPYDRSALAKGYARVVVCKLLHVDSYDACMMDGVYSRPPVDAHKAFTCSELVFTAYQQAGKPLGKMAPEASAPQSIVELNGTLHYVGHLQ